MIQISNTDMRALCRYLRDASTLYACHSKSTRDTDRARLLRKLHDKLAKKLISNHCERIKEQLTEINNA